MSAKKLLLAALITSMLNACGGGNTAAPLPADGDMNTPVVGDEYTSPDDMSTGGDDYSGGDTTASDTTSIPAEGFTLRGIVVDKQTKAPLKGATVTIGSSTQLTGDDGTFEIKDIQDTQIWVNVSKDGYSAIKQENIAFSEAKPTADKEFSLAVSTGGNTDDEDDNEDDEENENGFTLKHAATLGDGKFKTVSALAVEGNNVFVLGLVDKFLLDSVSVVAFDAVNGNEVRSFRSFGFLKNLPKSASYLKIDDGEVFVSNGEDAWVFNPTGTFLRQTGGASYENVKELEDEDNDVKYEVKSGNKLIVDPKGKPAVTVELDEVGSIKAIALGPDNTLVVLDGSNNNVHTFEYDKD